MGPGFRRDDVGMDSADPSQRLVLIAVAIELRRGDVAILVIVVVLWRRGRRRLFRLVFGLVVDLAAALALLSGLGHAFPLRGSNHLPESYSSAPGFLT